MEWVPGRQEEISPERRAEIKGEREVGELGCGGIWTVWKGMCGRKQKGEGGGGEAVWGQRRPCHLEEEGRVFPHQGRLVRSQSSGVG